MEVGGVDFNLARLDKDVTPHNQGLAHRTSREDVL